MATTNLQNPQSETPQYPQWQQVHREAQLKHQIEVDIKEKQREAQRQEEAAAEAKRREDGFKTAMALLKLPVPQSGTSLEIDGYIFSLSSFAERRDKAFRPTPGMVPDETTAPLYLTFEIMITTRFPEDITEQDVRDYAAEDRYCYDSSREWPVKGIAVARHPSGTELSAFELYTLADILDWVKDQAEIRAKEIRAWKENLAKLKEQSEVDELREAEESEKQAADVAAKPPSFSDQLVDLIRQLVRKEVQDLRMDLDF